MKFIDREEEMGRLDRVAAGSDAALVVVWGRRRLGKSRLLTEWCRKHGGTYWVADESAAAIQRRYLAEEMDAVFPGFSSVVYPDWTALFTRLSSEASQRGWHGPLVLDEFPYLVAVAPELPSILQRWVDREKRTGGVVLALSGSSQRMMMSHVLNSDAPLYGRADEILKIEPLRPGYIGEALPRLTPQAALDFYACWGGVPRYWELAHPFGADHTAAVDELVLSPLGVLHDEIERLLRQEMPSAIPLRPIMDAIGLGAHRSSEIAGRLQTAATSITRSIQQLQSLGYVRREVPFGLNEKRSKKAVYKLSDPFLRLWFNVVASHRGGLQSASKAGRRKLLSRVWPQLRAEAWEEICRDSVPFLRPLNRDWCRAGRYWAGHEWDLVSTSLEGDTLLLGECKSLSRPARPADINKIVAQLMGKGLPPLKDAEKLSKVYLIFVPAVESPAPSLPPNVHVVEGKQVFSALVQEP
jgi:AAA+ ATPase superfamily predicted ATPase